MEDEARVSPDRERPVGPKTQKGHGGLAWLSHSRVPPGSWSQPLIKRGENPRVQKGLDRRLPPGTKDRRVKTLGPKRKRPLRWKTADGQRATTAPPLGAH